MQAASFAALEGSQWARITARTPKKQRDAIAWLLGALQD